MISAHVEGKQLQFASLELAVILGPEHGERAGQVHDYGEVARFETVEHELSRFLKPTIGQRIARGYKKITGLLMLAGLAYGFAHRHDHAGALDAATVIVNGGQAVASNLLSGIGGTVPKFIGWGTGAGTAAVADTTLFTEAAETRATGTVTRVTTTVANDTMQVVGTMTSLSGQTITNAGLLDAVSSGNLYLKGDFTGVPLLTGDAIAFTFKSKLS